MFYIHRNGHCEHAQIASYWSVYVYGRMIVVDENVTHSNNCSKNNLEIISYWLLLLYPE